MTQGAKAVARAKRVLVIDDEKVVCNSCGRVLEQEGYEVSLTTDGHVGIERASREKFEVVIVDLRMPGIGGKDVLRMIKQNNPETRVIVITAYSSIATAVEMMQLGAVDYLPKPFTPKELTDRIRRLFPAVSEPAEVHVEEAPVAQEGKPASEKTEIAEEPSAEARILLAVSEPKERAALCEFLSSEPWDVIAAETHDEVLESVRGGRADVLVVGVDALGAKAYELICEVKKVTDNLPIIVASGDPSVDLARKIRELGIFFYLMEPFDAEEVKTAVRDAVWKAVMSRAPSAPSATRPGPVRRKESS